MQGRTILSKCIYVRMYVYMYMYVCFCIRIYICLYKIVTNISMQLCFSELLETLNFKLRINCDIFVTTSLHIFNLANTHLKSLTFTYLFKM